MRVRIPVTIAAIAMAFALSSTSLSAQSESVDHARSTSTDSSASTPAFAVLEGVTAAPMASDELEAVKGLHVHFVNPGKNTQFGLPGLHLAGDVKTENNWKNLGGTDPAAVAPSYNGLCVASGQSGPGNSVISIPFNPAVGTQCP